MNKIDQVVTNNLKTPKYQLNEAIDNELTFDINNFNLYSGTNDPLTVVTVFLREGKKHGATTDDGLTSLWDSRATDSTLKRKHTKN